MPGKTCLTFYVTFGNNNKVLLSADCVNNFNTPIVCHNKKEEIMMIGNIKGIHLAPLYDIKNVNCLWRTKLNFV